MGNKEKPSFKERKLVTAIGAACCVASLILSATALGTGNWITSNGCAKAAYNGSCDASETHLSVNYGLFSGVKVIDTSLSPNSYNIQFTCLAESNACMWSCASSADERLDELRKLLQSNYTGSLPGCTRIQQSGSQRMSTRVAVFEEASSNTKKFMDFGLWVATVVFMCFMVLFEIIASVLCVLNVVTNPIEVWTGPSGIYVSSGVSVLWGVLTMALWGGQFGTNLSVNVAVSETLTGEWIQETASLGYSFWLVLAAFLLNIVSCVCIRFRNVLRKQGGVGDEEDEPATNGVVLLF